MPILQCWVCYFILSFYHGSFWNFHRFRNTAEGERLAVIAYLPLHCILEVGDSKGEIFIWDIILHHPCIWALSVGIRARNREQGKKWSFGLFLFDFCTESEIWEKEGDEYIKVIYQAWAFGIEALFSPVKLTEGKALCNMHKCSISCHCGKKKCCYC